MAIKITPLTDTQIKSFKPLDKDKKYFDGGGLFLLVKTSGVKTWRMKYKKPINNKESLLSFGNYPETSLQQARKKRDDAIFNVHLNTSNPVITMLNSLTP